MELEPRLSNTAGEELQKFAIDESYRLIFELATVGVALIDPETGSHARANDKYCDIFGYSMCELLGIGVQKITHPDELQLDLESTARVLTGEIRSYTRDRRYLHKSGKVVCGKLTVSRTWGEEPPFLITVLEGITARQGEAFPSSKIRLQRPPPHVEEIAQQKLADRDGGGSTASPLDDSNDLQSSLGEESERSEHLLKESGKASEERESAFHLKKRSIALLNNDLRRRNAELQILLDTAPIGLAISYDPLGLSMRGNAALENLLGIQAHGEISKTALKPADYRVMRDGRELVASELPMQRAVRGEIVVGEALDVLRNDGMRLNLCAYATPLLDQQGKPSGAIGAFVDNTNRRRSEEKLLRQSMIFKAMNGIFEEALGSGSIEALGEVCLSVAEEITGSRIGFIGEIGPDGLLHDIAISNPGWDACRKTDLGGHRRLPGNFKIHALYGRVLLNGSGFFTNDPDSHPDGVGLPQGHLPLTSFLGVPLKKDGKTLGMIAVANNEIGYTDNELQVLEELSPVIVEAFQRKRVEHALYKKAEQQRLALESALLGSWEYNCRTGEVFWDERCRLMFGVQAGSSSEYDGVLKNIHAEDRLGIDQAVQQAVAGVKDGAYHQEFRVLWPDGSLHWVASHGQVYFAGEGSDRKAGQFIGVNMDITKRKQAEMELQGYRDHLETLVGERTVELKLRNSQLEVEIGERRRVTELLSQSEQRYRAVVEDQTETINRVRRDGRYTFVNDVFCRFFGKTSDELLGNNWLPNAHPDDGSMIEELLGTLSPDNPVVTIENRVFDSSGEVRWMQFVNRGFFDDQGELVESQAVGRDITEQKTIKQALQASEEQYRQLFEQMICGVMLVDVIFDDAGAPCDYRLVQANSAFENLTGLVAKDQIGRTSKDLSISWPDDVLQRFFQVAVTGEPIQYERFNETLGRYYETRVFSPHKGQFAHVFTDITDRKQLEDTLRKYAKEIQDLYDNAPCGYHSIDSNGLFVKINGTELKMLGYDAHEIVGVKSFFDLLEPESREALHDNFTRFKEVGYVNGLEYTLVRKDGSKFPVLLSATCIKDDHGNFVMSRGTLIDITERKKTDEILRKLSMAVEQSPVTIVMTDTNGNIEFVNPMFTSLTGYTQKEVLGTNSNILKYGNLDAEVYKKMWDTISSGNVWEGDFSNKKKTGELFFEHAKISPLKNSDGIITNYIAIKENVTQRKIAEDLLCQSERRFKQLFNQSNDAIIIIRSSDYSIIDCNEGAETMFGYCMEELIGYDIFSLMANPDRSFISLVGNVDKNYWPIEKISMLRKDGSYLLVSGKFKVVTLNSDEVFYCSFCDITDRIRLEEEALAAQARLIQADKMASLGLLVSGMAHEINNPNNCILFNSELLVKTWNSAMPILEKFYRENGDFKLGSFKFSETRDIISKLFSGLVDGAERIRSIVDMLKDFSRQDNGDILASFDVKKVITNAIAIVNHEIKKRCNHFYMESGQEIPPAIGNAQQVEQVMVNLIMNSLQSLPDVNCAVRINTVLDEDGEHIVITVVDEGEGMSSEVMEHLTDPFFTTRSDSGGTGLGLSITSSILQRNRGTISFNSAPGKGTTAKVKLRIFPGSDSQG